MASAAVYGEALLHGQRPEGKALAAELRALSDNYPDGPAFGTRPVQGTTDRTPAERMRLSSSNNGRLISGTNFSQGVSSRCIFHLPLGQAAV